MHFQDISETCKRMTHHESSCSSTPELFSPLISCFFCRRPSRLKCATSVPTGRSGCGTKTNSTTRSWTSGCLLTCLQVKHLPPDRTIPYPVCRCSIRPVAEGCFRFCSGGGRCCGRASHCDQQIPRRGGDSRRHWIHTVRALLCIWTKFTHSAETHHKENFASAQPLRIKSISFHSACFQVVWDGERHGRGQRVAGRSDAGAARIQTVSLNLESPASYGTGT